MVITIDGAAGVGKTSTAKELAKRLGYQYFDTGAMYRAVTFFFINQNVNLTSVSEVNNSLKSIKLHIDFSSESDMRIFLDEDDISLKIRSQEVTSKVSAVSAIKEVREMMVQIQRSFTKKGNFVVEGRDIGTVVFLMQNINFIFKLTMILELKEGWLILRKLMKPRILTKLKRIWKLEISTIAHVNYLH